MRWSLDSSLAKFGLDYVDLFLIHWPIAAEKDNDNMPKLNGDGQYVIKQQLTKDPKPTWQAMEQLQKSGKARAIGVSNWTIDGLKHLLSWAEVKPVVNQIEIHPFLPNDELVKFCLENSIMPQAYSPLGSQNQVPNTGEKVNTNPTLNKIAEKGGNTLAQVLIAWGVRRGYVVLPKSSTPSRIESNFKTIELSDDDFAAVNEVAKGRHTRFVNMKVRQIDSPCTLSMLTVIRTHLVSMCGKTSPSRPDLWNSALTSSSGQKSQIRRSSEYPRHTLYG